LHGDRDRLVPYQVKPCVTATAAAADGGERREIEMLITSLETQRDRPALSVAAV